MTARAIVRLAFFFQAEDGIRDWSVTGVQTCALPICSGEELALGDHPAQLLGDRRRQCRAFRCCASGFGAGAIDARQSFAKLAHWYTKATTHYSVDAMHKLLARRSQTSVRFTLVYQLRRAAGFTSR